jgi:hypothetical protein
MGQTELYVLHFVSILVHDQVRFSVFFPEYRTDELKKLTTARTLFKISAIVNVSVTSPSKFKDKSFPSSLKSLHFFFMVIVGVVVVNDSFFAIK